MMRRWLTILAFLAAGQPASAQEVAEEVIAGMSQSWVSITANFDGSEILIFGAIRREAPPPESPPLEVIVTVAGPASPVDVRMKSREYGIWMNTEAVEIDSAPHFYVIATTGPLFDIISHTEDLRHRVSIPRGIRSVGAPPEIADSARFTDALIRLREREGLYREAEGSINLVRETLFDTRVALPANLVEGPYAVRIFLTRGRQVLDVHETAIDVRKVGLERFLYTLAHERPPLYGLLALVIAVAAGWGASAAFRLLRP